MKPKPQIAEDNPGLSNYHVPIASAMLFRLSLNYFESFTFPGIFYTLLGFRPGLGLVELENTRNFLFNCGFSSSPDPPLRRVFHPPT